MQVFAGLTLLLKTESYVGANIWSNNYNDINDPTLAETTYGSSKRSPEGCEVQQPLPNFIAGQQRD
jgi:hypothetical protein